MLNFKKICSLFFIVSVFLPNLASAATTTESASSTNPLDSLDAIKAASQNVNGAIEGGRDVINKAESFVNTVSNTVSKAQAAYNQTKAVVEQGQRYYDQGLSAWQKFSAFVEPVTSKAAPAWDKISNHNDPTRILIIAGIVLVLYLLLKFRRARYREFYDR